MASSKVAIANRALQKLGAQRISALDENHPNARSASAAYDAIRESLLRRYDWNFAIARKSIAASATDTIYEGLKRYPLPNDFLRLLRQEFSRQNESTRRDWQIEGNHIVTADGSPLKFRYIKNEEDPAIFDSTFSELFAATLAKEVCEEVTSSKGLVDRLDSDVAAALFDARQANAFENDADVPPEDDWLLARL